MSSNASEDEPERPGGERRNPFDKPSDDAVSQEHSSEGAGEKAQAAGRGSGRGKAKKPRSFWKELPILIGIALVLAFLIQQFLARVYMIPSGSMEETLHGCPGCTPDRILVDKLVYNFTDPDPGEVVVFRGPDAWVGPELAQDESNAVAEFFQMVGSAFGLAPPDERDFVKRIIATGGQTVECCDDENRVLVDGEPLDEPYLLLEGDRPQSPFPKVTIPEGYVWMMGDNRNNSADSRSHNEEGTASGAVPEDAIVGKARLIVLPPSRWGVISSPNPQEEQANAMSAPTWQQGIPLGVGVIAAWPVLKVGRGVASAVGGAVRRDR
ncbi:signal peptidase I [Saccharomonospora sp. CUA-673]|uniref:signal peptidase I n=1 Tax=Saccharomonospora sp. CUA-673 TaxID=1904969 RepID=UPI0009603D5D|nr:signal peptidase I [Saccharomonospora sp. CUA-673]